MTKQQHETLIFIADYIDERGFAPSVKEVSREFGRISTNAAHQRLVHLERDGLITRQPRVARSIVLTEQGLALSGRLSPDRIRTTINRTRASDSGQCTQTEVASPQKENER